MRPSLPHFDGLSFIAFLVIIGTALFMELNQSGMD